MNNLVQGFCFLGVHVVVIACFNELFSRALLSIDSSFPGCHAGLRYEGLLFNDQWAPVALKKKNEGIFKSTKVIVNQERAETHRLDEKCSAVCSNLFCLQHVSPH